MKKTFFDKIKKSVGLTLLLLVLSVSVAAAALTFTGTQLTGDGALTINASTTMNLGTSETTVITIGRAGQTVSFPGSVSSSALDASGLMDIGTSTATTIAIGRSGQTVRFPGNVSSTAIDSSALLHIGTSTATTIVIGRSGQTVSFPGTASSSALIANTSFRISTGTPMVYHHSATSSITFGSISSSTPCSEMGISVSSTAVGDTVAVGPPSSVASNTSWSAYASSTDTVAIRLCYNWNSGSNTTVVPVAGVWRADIWKH